MAEDVRARMWETGGRWYAHILDSPAFIEVTGTSQRGCIGELRKVIGDDVSLTVEVVPRIVGVAEAAEIMGWDKRRVVTYLDRGQFPEPLTSLASGRIWLREDVERYAKEWRELHPRPATFGAPST
ncbi:MAG: hypothetical protein ACRDH7_12810 [Actinomycetota bacterium]